MAYEIWRHIIRRKKKTIITRTVLVRPSPFLGVSAGLGGGGEQAGERWGRYYTLAWRRSQHGNKLQQIRKSFSHINYYARLEPHKSHNKSLRKGNPPARRLLLGLFFFFSRLLLLPLVTPVIVWVFFSKQLCGMVSNSTRAGNTRVKGCKCSMETGLRWGWRHA